MRKETTLFGAQVKTMSSSLPVGEVAADLGGCEWLEVDTTGPGGLGIANAQSRDVSTRTDRHTDPVPGLEVGGRAGG